MNFSTSSLFDRMLCTLFRPLVSMLIKNSVHYQRITLLFKQVYIDVAATEYGKNGRPTNISRISLLTGIDRKEVKRIRDQQDQLESSSPSSQSGALGRVLSAWYTHPKFSRSGQPLPLDITTEFADLCKHYGGDITRTAILNELLRVRAATTLVSGKVVATSRYYMPEQTDHEALRRTMDVYTDLGNTLNHNLYRDIKSPSQFEGRATNPAVPTDKVAEFRQFVEHKGQEFLEIIDHQLSSYEDTDNSQIETVRLGLGVYWIENTTEIDQ